MNATDRLASNENPNSLQNPPRRLERSIAAIVVRFVTVVVLSLGTDEIFHVMGTAGVSATIPMNLGPAWYPIATLSRALPCAWLGGVLDGRGNSGQT